MSIYNKSGTELGSAYNKSGSLVSVAYNKSGSLVYSTNPRNIKIMSYNCGGWYIGSGTNIPSSLDSQYYALQNGMLTADDPDILCLQEYWTNMSSTRTAESMLEQHFQYIEARNGSNQYFGRAICSKYPISNYTQHSYTSESNRYFDSCTITIDGVAYTVVTTHLGLQIANRRSQISELLSFLEGVNNFIVCGDFNTVDCLSSSGEDYTDIITPIINKGYNLANCYGNQSTFLVTYSERPDNTSNDLVLDNIITPGGIALRNISVDTTKLTDGINAKVDHMPLLASI